MMNPTFAKMMTIPDLIADAPPACPVCAADQWQKSGQVKDYSVSGEWFELLKCGSCGLIMTYPQPPEAKIGRYYASTEYISHSDTRKGLINSLYHKAREYMLRQKYKWVTQASGKQNGRLLDVGAGTGHFAHYMSRQGWQVTGLEPDPTARKVALEKLQITIEPLENLASQPTGQFDVITLWHVLEHVHDLNGYLSHFHELLHENGTLIIAVPNYTSADAIHYGNKWAAYDVPRHLWHFHPVSMELLFSKHGFTLSSRTQMPLDAFYVSMLSEKYKGQGVLGLITAFGKGLKSWRQGKRDAAKASSVIYVGRKLS